MDKRSELMAVARDCRAVARKIEDLWARQAVLDAAGMLGRLATGSPRGLRDDECQASDFSVAGPRLAQFKKRLQT